MPRNYLRTINSVPTQTGTIEMLTHANSIGTELNKFLARGAEIVYSDYSGLYFIKESYNGQDKYYTLDRLAQLVKNKNGVVSAPGGRRIRLSKQNAEKLARDLRSQAERLRALSSSYELLATALSVSIDNIEDITSVDETFKKSYDNPF